MSDAPISMFDHVRVLDAPETRAAGVAGRTGVVYGESMPEHSGVGPVIGALPDGWAINVAFEDVEGEFWFAPTLLELVDHAAGTEFWLQGSPVRFRRREDGSWEELPGPPTLPPETP